MKIKIRTDLLRKLANHVYNPRTKRNNRKLDKFRFDKLATNTICGTVGCALGELPYCFPGQWRVAGLDSILVVGTQPVIPSLVPICIEWPDASSVASAAADFFGISYGTSLMLFYPTSGSSLGVLPGNSTAEQVAAHIRKYCAKVEARRK